MNQVIVEHGGERRTATAETWQAVADELIAKHGPGVPRVEPVIELSATSWKCPLCGQHIDDGKACGCGARTVSKPLSTFAVQVMDDAAKVRIEATHQKLADAGIKVDTSEQLFATGTRMAAEGYAKQTQRAAEHAAKMPVAEAALRLRTAVVEEKRRDVTVTAKELAASVRVNGAVTVLGGYALREQAIRGITSRIGSPALGYLLGLRDRIAAESRSPERNANLIAADKAEMAEVLQHELERFGAEEIKLRLRDGNGDVFAAVSPSYVPADAPEVIDRLVSGLPGDAKGSWAYDPATTTWELRAAVWTPTPVQEQAVGEPFEAYASFGSRDNGTRKFSGGGGVELIRCLNATTYCAEGARSRRVHRGSILVDVAQMVVDARAALDAVCAAWSTSREQVVEEPAGIPLEQAFPGWWRWLLTDRRSELAGVLPGRTEERVAMLVAAQRTERRDEQRVVRSDFGQAWTRYIQDEPPAVRRDAEAAAGDWLVSGRKVGCDLRDA